MRRKFGQYAVDAKKEYLAKRADGLLESRVTISGDIEIGLYIEPMTWREDWLADFVFGKDGHDDISLVNVQNNYDRRSAVETNEITAIWRERR